MKSFLTPYRLTFLALATSLVGLGCASSSKSTTGESMTTTQSQKAENVHVGLLVRLEAKPGKEGDVQKFLEGGLPLVQAEPATAQWFALRFGPTSFGIFDTFADEAGRQAHLGGKVAAALMAQAPELFATPPSIQSAELLATKAPGTPEATDQKALVVILEAKSGKEGEVQKFLEGGLPIVRDEPATLHWYAIRLSPTTFGIVDTFPDEAGRQAHLGGKVAAALMAQAPELLAKPPVIEQVDVLAVKR
ncbi:putative quinol monooxygenase [Corallococcus llansteffanensis]|uniref:putative quinol monooxygenase n=1 Tax=Corallococcus llansteffanensis TaxID=2316731 RepID=UPI001FCA0FAA|nr:hypothetical protein [Corallococcus llansteffanensis]